jgi:hypothetical protein
MMASPERIRCASSSTRRRQREPDVTDTADTRNGPRRGPAWAAAAAALVAVAAGLTAGSTLWARADPTGGRRSTPAALPYVCRDSAAARPASLLVTVRYPAAAAAGATIQAAQAVVTVILPRSLLGRPAPGGRSVSGRAALAGRLVQRGTSSSWTWSPLSVAATPVPAAGSLRLTAIGVTAPVAVHAGSPLTVTAGRLSLLLTLGPAGTSTLSPSPAPSSPAPSTAPPTPAPSADAGTSATAGTAHPAATPPAGTLRLTCTPKAGHSPILATIAVTGLRRAAAAPDAASKADCPRLPKGGLKLNPRLPPPPRPPRGSLVFHGPTTGCGYVTGYSDVRKLDDAVAVPPTLTNLDIGITNYYNLSKNYFQQDGAAELDYHGKREFPPLSGTFLGFGFMPVSATIQLREVGTVNIYVVGNAVAPYTKPTVATVYTLVTLSVAKTIYVNGMPLNVGPACRAASPFVITLSGTNKSKPPYGPLPYGVFAGGPLTGEITIPPFTGCGVSENLDPLLTATVSGPRNFTLQTQGLVCIAVGPPPGACPPKPPTPLRHVRLP